MCLKKGEKVLSPKCNVCGNKLSVLFPTILDPITKETFAIHKCLRCGLGHTVPQPKNITRYYGPVYYGNRHSLTSSHCTKRRLGFLNCTTSKHNGKKLLDIGCGDGSFLIAARNLGWDVSGTEINPDLAKTSGLNVEKSIGNLSNFGQFDCITMWHSLEHLMDIKSTLSQVSKLLKPNGTLMIAVPDNGGLQAKFFKCKWLHLDVPRHRYHFDKDSLSFSLKDAGFTVQHQWHQEIEYDLMGWSQSVLNCFFITPNIFLDILMGKKKRFNICYRIINFVMGSILSILSILPVAVEMILRRGGTLVVVAYRIK